jgi:hypothetical protein
MSEGAQIHGRLSLTVVKPDGTVRDYREGDNVITVNGYTVMAAALVWAGLQDQATELGLTTATYMTPLWGAVGSGSGTPTLTDTALFSELGRETVGAGASSPATTTIPSEATWLFYFPPPATTWTVTEAGIFANASSASGSGTMVDHWAFSPTVTVPTTDTLILQVGLQLGP